MGVLPSSVASRRRNIVLASILPLAAIWALAGLAMVIAHAEQDWQATAGVLMVAQAFSGAVVWFRLKALRAAILPDFLTLILFVQFVAKTVTLLGIVLKAFGDTEATVVDHLAKLADVPNEYQFQAELVFLLATVVFAVFWRLQEGKRPAALWSEPPVKAAWATYGIGIAGYLGLSFTGLNVGLGMVHELLRLFAIGAVAVLLGGNSEYGLGRSRSWLAFTALVPLLALALRSGMKAEVGLVALPILLPMLKQLSTKRMMVLGGFVMLMVLFVAPFSMAWREANWVQYGRSENADIAEVASRVIRTWETNGVLETAQLSTARLLSRSSTAEAGGLVMQLAERDGFIGPVLIEGLATIFVPRFLWPEKPSYTPGAWFTWYLGHAKSPETATTSTAMMLPTELYWMFGLWGVVIGMAGLAVVYFQVWRFLVKGSAKGLVPTVALFAMLGRSAGMEEVHTIYAISSPIILLVYVLGFDKLHRMLMSGSRNKSAVEEPK